MNCDFEILISFGEYYIGNVIYAYKQVLYISVNHPASDVRTDTDHLLPKHTASLRSEPLYVHTPLSKPHVSIIIKICV